MIVAEDNTAIIMTETTFKIVFFIYQVLTCSKDKYKKQFILFQIGYLLGRVSIDRKVSNEASGAVAF